MKAKWGGEHEISRFLKGGNRNFNEVCLGEQLIFMNLDPIPGAYSGKK